MIEQADVSTLKSMAVAILSGLALLALRGLSMLLRQAISGEKVPFLRVSIDFGLYRISVSQRPLSSSSKKPGRRMVARVSGYTAGRSRRVASSSNVLSVVSSNGGTIERSAPSKSFDGRQLEPANDD